MYGLVNIAIEQIISQRFGWDAWQRIADAAGAPAHGFVSMEAYDDSITYGLVAAASSELDLTQEQILEAFGEYWILYTAAEGYGELLELSGDTFEEFLRGLDTMHTRVALSYPQLQPPSFRCEKCDDGTLELHYTSHRSGLAPMVIGLLRGLAKRFEVQISVEQRAAGSDDDSTLIFAITILE